MPRTRVSGVAGRFSCPGRTLDRYCSCHRVIVVSALTSDGLLSRASWCCHAIVFDIMVILEVELIPSAARPLRARNVANLRRLPQTMTLTVTMVTATGGTHPRPPAKPARTPSQSISHIRAIATTSYNDIPVWMDGPWLTIPVLPSYRLVWQ
jgi:hypothetical protein